MGKVQSKADKEVLRINKLLKITEKITHLKDIEALLDRILIEARKFTSADGGTIYLVDNKKLRFRYVQNDSLFKAGRHSNKHLYVDHSVPIDQKSIVGYVYKTGKTLIIDDAYNIDKSVPYTCNHRFDETASYKTKSLLTIPLRTSRGRIVGVLQLINAQDKKGNIVIFSPNDIIYVEHFANNAAIAVERAKMTRAMVLRMMKVAELRDPKETGPHVNRVGSYSIEIYHQWAHNKGQSVDKIKQFKDNFRIAAMMHDMGKVAISDTILKKPAKLTSKEYEIMKTHVVMGARLFNDPTSDWDEMAAEISLNHHEKWDGTGYPGKIDDIFKEPIEFHPGKKGEEIPITARIVALSDVYDALISKRSYKDAWDEKQVLDYIKEQSGHHFDPEIVEVFFDIYDVIAAIRDTYKD